MAISTKVAKLSFNPLEDERMEAAATIIREGGLVIFPTETVYGLGANALDKEAAAKIYSAKGRPSDNPLIVHISKIKDLHKVSNTVTKEALCLADKFWPGPLTMILPKAKIVPLETTGGLSTVAVRMPNNPIALELINKSRVPIAAPSANLSGRPSPTRISHVIEDMAGRVDMIINGGDVELGLESTIVDLTTDIATILRSGFITKEDIEKALGKPVKGRDDTIKEVYRPKAPGMKYRHYAPKGDIFIVCGEKKRIPVKIKELVEEYLKEGKKVAVIGTEENKDFYNEALFYNLGSGMDGKKIANNLYDAIHRMDTDNIELALSEPFYEVDHGEAIMERMEKAAEYRFIDA